MKTTTAAFKEKVSYMFSAMGYEFETMVVASYFMLFCTDVMQIDVKIVGYIFLFLKILDAITDILITNIADKTSTRWGKYRPWLLAGIPLAVCMFLCFWYPAFLTDEWVKILWVTVLLVITVSIFETSYMCPFLVLNAVMSDDPRDQLHFATAKTLGENIADFVVNYSAMTIVLAFGSYKDLAGWRVLGTVFSVITILCVLIGFLGVRERVQVTTSNEAGETLSLREKLGLLKGNRPFYKLLGLQVSYQIAWFATLTMFTYFGIYVLGHEEWVSSLSSLGVLMQVAVSLATPRLAQKFEKRTLVFAGSGCLLLSGIVLVFVNSYAAALVYQLLRGAGIGIVLVCNFAMWPEVVDYTARRTGLVSPGIIYSVESFFTKLSIAVGTFYATQALELGGYVSDAFQQSETTILWIRMSMSVLLIVSAVLIFLMNALLKELRSQKTDGQERA